MDSITSQSETNSSFPFTSSSLLLPVNAFLYVLWIMEYVNIVFSIHLISSNGQIDDCNLLTVDQGGGGGCHPREGVQQLLPEENGQEEAEYAVGESEDEKEACAH